MSLVYKSWSQKGQLSLFTSDFDFKPPFEAMVTGELTFSEMPECFCLVAPGRLVAPALELFGLAVSTVAAQLNAALYSQLNRHKVEQTMKRGI